MGSSGEADSWAIATPLITTAKLNEIEPDSYLEDIIERTTSTYLMSQIDEFLPRN